MSGFRDILGHEQIIANFKNAARTGQVSHAYILNGPEGSGKRMLAEAFSMLLVCEAPRDGEPCGECVSCRQAMGRNHPDILWVTHEKAGITVDDVRRQIIRSADILPYRSRYKVYIVDEAEKMNVQAQNALLKTLEEPPAYVVILLLTTNADLFLPTILSRCVRLDLKAVSDDRIRAHLITTFGIPEREADLCVAFAQGNVGCAMSLASSESFGEIRDRLILLIGSLRERPSFELGQELQFLEGRKEDSSLFLDLLLLFFRDVLLYKSTGGEEGLAFREQTSLIREIAGTVSYNGLNQIFTAVDNACTRLRMNVNAPLTVELLFYEIKENLEE